MTIATTRKEPAVLYAEWLDAYESAYLDPESLPDLPCPSCGAKTLQLRFPMLPPAGDSEGAGYAAFWCGTCEQGLMTCRTPIPPWAQWLLTDAEAAAAQKVGIPSYKIIPPVAAEGEGEYV
jgi:hypothetical protein